MPKIDCTKPLTNLDGETIPTSEKDPSPFTVGKAIANILIVPRKDRQLDNFKSYELAKKFFKSNEVELDKADFAAVKEMVETDQAYTPLIIGQLLEVLTTK